MTLREEIRRSESMIALSGFGERYWRRWSPPSPKRVMVLVHGYAEHTGRYEEDPLVKDRMSARFAAGLAR